MTADLLADSQSAGSALSTHPMDSSRILLSMMSLARQGEVARRDESDSLEGLVSLTVLRRLLAALNFRDPGTLHHSRRVALLAVGMAQQLRWEGRHLRRLEVAALLHDIGKIGVPDNILLKPARLSPDEAELISVHHNIGADVLQACRLDKEIIQIVLDAHDFYDFLADSSRSVGAEISLAARILAVADAYDSLTHNQVFRPGKTSAEALALLAEDAGTKFDGNVVSALSRWVERGGVASLMKEEAASLAAESYALQDHETIRDAGSLCHIFSYLYVLESLYDGFYILDSDLRLVVWSHGAETLLGRPCSQVLGQQWSSHLLNYGDRAGRRLSDRECPIHQVMRTSTPVCEVLQVQQRSGPWIEVELQSIPLIDRNGTLHGVAEIFRDTSRSKRNAPQFRELKLAASRDPLTGVANRGELEKHLRRMFDDFHRQETDVFSVVFLDIDHFKSINDTHGHGVGDRVLAAVARLLQAELYSGELVARYGGEEFVILCPSTDLDAALRKAERLRTALAETTIGEQPRISATASLGVAQIESDDNVESLLGRADAALYDAKQSGRNRTCHLTRQDVAAKQPVDPSRNGGASQPHVFEAQFTTCMTAQMATYKIASCVTEMKARLGKVSAERVTMQVGQLGLFRRWGSDDAYRPVEIALQFGEPDEQPKKTAAKRVLVYITITPLGRPSSAEDFFQRAKRTYELLRSNFAAD
jgi:diguanylate cyclase (GGDEF)-like protein/putative nucleotidyltransferase with HDIG domain/PAS domain S-box-containing protein